MAPTTNPGPFFSRVPRAHAAAQPFTYPLQREWAEPDWTRLPGFRDVTRAEWETAQWQRAHTVKNLRQLMAAFGDLFPGGPARLGRAGPGRAGHHVDAAPAPDAQHHGRAGPLGRPGAPLHAPGLRRPRSRVAQPPAVDPRQPARGRHVGGRGPDPPLPHQGAGRAAAHLPPVLRPLHPHGPGRQLHPPGGQVQVRDQAAHPARADPRLPAPDPERPRRGRVRRGRGQPAHPGARAVRLGPARHRQHPRHPPGLQGPDGPAPALPPGRRPGRPVTAWPPRPTTAGSTWPCTPT